jgi:hypothetical protein
MKFFDRDIKRDRDFMTRAVEQYRILTYRQAINTILDNEAHIRTLVVAISNKTQLRCIADALRLNEYIQNVCIKSTPLQIGRSRDPEIHRYMEQINRNIATNGYTSESSSSDTDNDVLDPCE